VSTSKNIRVAIAVYFEYVLGSPLEEDWKELHTISTIAEVFQNPHKSFKKRVRKVCTTKVLECQEASTPCTGSGNYESAGRPALIKNDSIEAQIVADAVESGNSIKASTYILNLFRELNAMESLTYSAVRNCIMRLQPQIKSATKAKQEGSKNKESAWCRASLRWVAQLLLLRFGKVDFRHEMFKSLLGEAYDINKPPPCYDMTMMRPLHL